MLQASPEMRAGHRLSDLSYGEPAKTLSSEPSCPGHLSPSPIPIPTPVTPVPGQDVGLPSLSEDSSDKENSVPGTQQSVVSTPFYSLPVHSLFSSPPPPPPLPLTALIPTSFANLREVLQPSRDNPILCSVSLNSLIPPISTSVSRSLLDHFSIDQLIRD